MKNMNSFEKNVYLKNNKKVSQLPPEQKKNSISLNEKRYFLQAHKANKKWQATAYTT